MKAFYETRNEPYFIGAMTDYPFPLHVHEIVELAVVLEGGCTMQLDGETYALSAGDAAIAFPMAPHSVDAIEPGTKGFAAFFPADMIGEYERVVDNETGDIYRAYNGFLDDIGSEQTRYSQITDSQYAEGFVGWIDRDS